jgi:hypothetical protein
MTTNFKSLIQVLDSYHNRVGSRAIRSVYQPSVQVNRPGEGV